MDGIGIIGGADGPTAIYLSGGIPSGGAGTLIGLALMGLLVLIALAVVLTAIVCRRVQQSALFLRRSIRKFRQKAVPEKLLAQVLAAGKAAPSAKNRQPWKFIVYNGSKKDSLLDCMEAGIRREEGDPLLPDSKAGIADAWNTLRIMRQAPVLIAVLNGNGKSPFVPLSGPDERIMELCDTLSIGAAVENMLIRAQELGLGTLWIANTCYAYPELTDFLQTGVQLSCAVALGYAAEKPGPRPRKPDREIIEYR